MLHEDQLYHIVFSNEDPNPETNFLSVDALYVQSPTVPLQPAYDDLDCALLLRSGSGAWTRRKGHTPIMELIYEDGQSTGVGYMEAWIGATQTISGTDAVRETFVVKGAERKVNMAGVRVARVKGTASLRVRLEDSDGAVLEEGEISAAQMPITKPASYVWVTYRFVSSHTLRPGETYHLVLQSAASSAYHAYPVRKGFHYGFRDSTYFADGHAQFKENGEWVGWTQWSAKDRKDGDLQFYLELAP
jgi:hypothetical protein